jgi:hypothetical protein
MCARLVGVQYVCVMITDRGAGNKKGRKEEKEEGKEKKKTLRGEKGGKCVGRVAHGGKGWGMVSILDSRARVCAWVFFVGVYGLTALLLCFCFYASPVVRSVD